MPKKNSSTRPEPAKSRDLARELMLVLKEQGSVRAGERIGIGVSGGADSVALLHLFLDLQESLGIVPCVLHFNHKLRGKASDADEKFVAKLAAQHGLEFFVAQEDIGAKARRERSNLEDAGRRARYGFFEQLVRDGHVSRVAVAHTADDQAETVLAHILRGTGLAGLGGIHPRAGVVFRPLLRIRRADLRAYLRAKRQAWREDATNLDIKRTRARIRQKLIPMLEKEFQPAVVEHLCQLAEFAREDEAYLEKQAADWAKKAVQGMPSEACITLSEFPDEAHAIKTRLVRLMVEGLKPRAGQLSAAHVQAVLHLVQHPDSGKSLYLPGGVEVRRERDALRFRAAGKHPREDAAEALPKSYCCEVDLRPVLTQVPIVELSAVLHLRVIDWPSEGRETKLTGAVLDRERLGSPLVLRNWRPGDAMQPLGHRKRHKLARLLNEIGVSRWEKELWPVLTSGGKLAWVRGLPVAAEFAASEQTQTAVVITEEREP